MPTIEIKQIDGRTAITFDGFEVARKSRSFGTLVLLNRDEALSLVDDIKKALEAMVDLPED